MGGPINTVCHDINHDFLSDAIGVGRVAKRWTSGQREAVADEHE